MGYIRTYVPRLLLSVFFAGLLSYILVLIFYIGGVKANDLYWPILLLSGGAVVEFILLPRFLGVFPAFLYAATMLVVAWLWMSSARASVPWQQLVLVGCLFLVGKGRFLCLWDREKDL